jgi:hypothetical protein
VAVGIDVNSQPSEEAKNLAMLLTPAELETIKQRLLEQEARPREVSPAKRFDVKPEISS